MLCHAKHIVKVENFASTGLHVFVCTRKNFELFLVTLVPNTSKSIHRRQFFLYIYTYLNFAKNSLQWLDRPAHNDTKLGIYSSSVYHIPSYNQLQVYTYTSKIEN